MHALNFEIEEQVTLNSPPEKIGKLPPWAREKLESGEVNCVILKIKPISITYVDNPDPPA